MRNTTEENIIDFINSRNLNKDESLTFIDDLYWGDWDILDNEYPEAIDKIFAYLSREDLSAEELSQVLKLYNNPHGAYIEKFAKLILEIYSRDKKTFLRALNLESEEAINLVYVFRMNDIKLDEDIELLEIIESKDLSDGEVDTAKKFLKMYENICNT